ncbi:MAG: hypothetical protein IAI49_02580 [Candidatus Eremiobacteraeota bacterium]|nr:hypothetical protein [Candidatus Eremiobacteraeota bacterium]
MEPHEPGHPDPSDAPVLTNDRLVRDTATNDVRSVDAWIAEHMAREGRERSECLDELVNAIARGDVTVVE